MDIKFKDNPLTIKTVEIDGKKLTKPFLQQVPITIFNFVKIDDASSVYGYPYFYYNDSARFEGYRLDGELIGWINARIDSIDRVCNSTENAIVEEVENLVIILFADNNGQLKRGYIHRSIYNDMFGNTYPQIYI